LRQIKAIVGANEVVLRLMPAGVIVADATARIVRIIEETAEITLSDLNDGL